MRLQRCPGLRAGGRSCRAGGDARGGDDVGRVAEDEAIGALGIGEHTERRGLDIAAMRLLMF